MSMATGEKLQRWLNADVFENSLAVAISAALATHWL
jgi:hypothetical protein